VFPFREDEEETCTARAVAPKPRGRWHAGEDEQQAGVRRSRDRKLGLPADERTPLTSGGAGPKIHRLRLRKNARDRLPASHDQA
jgi:hypothetical protein